MGDFWNNISILGFSVYLLGKNTSYLATLFITLDLTRYRLEIELKKRIVLSFESRQNYLLSVFLLTSLQMPGRMTHKGGTETDDQARLRFQIELEFVQCLANPHYVTFLAQRGYLKDNAFINYLRYLLYWKQAEYAKYIKYPICLYFLDLLQYEHFRREIVNAQCAKFIDDQMVLLWQYYTRKRTKLLQNACEYSIPNTHAIQNMNNINDITVPSLIKNTAQS